jgi:PAS domain S-box-containing protein
MEPTTGGNVSSTVADPAFVGQHCEMHDPIVDALKNFPVALTITDAESSLPLVVLDADQRFVRVNTAACQFFGRSHEDLLGRSVMELIAAGSAAENGTGAELRASALAPGGEEDWGVQRPDGSVVWGRVRSMHLESGDGPRAGRLTLIEV